jgi:hypothetical protein
VSVGRSATRANCRKDPAGNAKSKNIYNLNERYKIAIKKSADKIAATSSCTININQNDFFCNS